MSKNKQKRKDRVRDDKKSKIKSLKTNSKN